VSAAVFRPWLSLCLCLWLCLCRDASHSTPCTCASVGSDARADYGLSLVLPTMHEVPWHEHVLLSLVPWQGQSQCLMKRMRELAMLDIPTRLVCLGCWHHDIKFADVPRFGDLANLEAAITQCAAAADVQVGTPAFLKRTCQRARCFDVPFSQANSLNMSIPAQLRTCVVALLTDQP
jgi:hypothetical protein